MGCYFSLARGHAGAAAVCAGLVRVSRGRERIIMLALRASSSPSVAAALSAADHISAVRMAPSRFVLVSVSHGLAYFPLLWLGCLISFYCGCRSRPKQTPTSAAMLSVRRYGINYSCLFLLLEPHFLVSMLARKHTTPPLLPPHALTLLCPGHSF